MKKVIKKTVTTTKATQPVENKVAKKTPIKKVVPKKQAEPEVDEESLNSIYDEIIAVAVGLGESTDEYAAVIDEATSVLVERDMSKLEEILASTKEQVESMLSKKKTSKKPTKIIEKKVVGKAKEETPASKPEKKVVSKKETLPEGEIKEFEGIKIGDTIKHPKNGKGEVKGFYKDKNKDVYHPRIKFENGKLSIISINVASDCK